MMGLFAGASYAQSQQPRHEISLWAAGGYSTFLFDIDKSLGSSECGFGGFAGLGYNYYFNYHWAIGTGVELSALNLWKGKINLKGGEDFYDESFDVMGNEMRYWTSIYNYEQTPKAFYLQVPLTAQYQVDVWKEHKFYAKAGLKVGIPALIDSKFKTEGDIVFRGGEKDLFGPNFTWYGSKGVEELGGVTYGEKTISDENKLDLNINFLSTIEAGMKWKLCKNYRWWLYTGLFLDYGWNDAPKRVEGIVPEHIYGVGNIDWQTPSNTEYIVGNLLSSSYGVYDGKNGGDGPQKGYDAKPVAIDDCVHTFAAGVKVALSFGFKPMVAKKQKVEYIPEPEPEKEGPITESQMARLLENLKKGLIDDNAEETQKILDALAKEDPYDIGSVHHFVTAKYDIVPSMYPTLENAVRVLKEHPEATVTLIGHTDDRASVDYNIGLGMNRAQAVKNYLVAQGIDESRLSISSEGKSQPAVANSTEQSRSYNRRVVFRLDKHE
jgi:outer membrane protein OmpA-like peptidoglycan-associated protein